MRFTEITPTRTETPAENGEVLYSITAEYVYAVAEREGIPRQQVQAAMLRIENAIGHGFECESVHEIVLDAIREGIRNETHHA